MKLDDRSTEILVVALFGLTTAACGPSGGNGDGESSSTLGAPTNAPVPSQSTPVTGTSEPAQASPSPSAAPKDDAQGPAPDDGSGAHEAPVAIPTSDPTGGSPAPSASESSSDAGAVGGMEPPSSEPPPTLTDLPPEPEAPGDAQAPEPMDTDSDMAMPPQPDPVGDTFGPDIEGSCTPSQPANSNASGSGPHDVVVETNADPGIEEGTIFRPAELGGGEPYPIFVWGEGGCSRNGLSNAAAMAEIASHGYFVVADGTPNGSGSRTMNSNDVPSMGQPLLAYVDWALAENSKPCSAYYHALNATKIAANGFSCGGLMSTGTAGDPRITTWGSTSSGTFSPDQALYQSIHTPVLIIEGGPSDIAYENGLRDYEHISQLGHPIMFFSKDIGHGGDLGRGGSGDFTKLNLAWLNWWLKDDETQSGRGALVGAGCSYCTDGEWEVMSANLP